MYFLMYEFRLSAHLPFAIFSASDKYKAICGKRKMANGESILALFWEDCSIEYLFSVLFDLVWGCYQWNTVLRDSARVSCL